MKINILKKLLDEFGENVKFEHDLKKKNWFNIGGKSKVFYKAENLKQLVKFLKKLDNKERLFILGAGSNTLITDDMFDGVVIKLGKHFNNISLLGEDIIGNFLNLKLMRVMHSIVEDVIDLLRMIDLNNSLWNHLSICK